MIIDERYTKPNNRFDIKPYGTIYKVIQSTNITHYIQVSKQENKCKWMQIGEFFEIVFSKDIDDEEFINICLKTLENL